MSGINTITYNFSINTYRMNFKTELVRYSTLLFCLYLIFIFVAIIKDMIGTLYIPLAFFSIFIILYIIKNIITYYKGNKIIKQSYVVITKNADNKSDDIKVYFRGSIYDVFWSINRIESLRRKQASVVIKGEMIAEYNYDKGMGEDIVELKKKLKIPAYFENMDEIYHSLLRLKEQPSK